MSLYNQPLLVTDEELVIDLFAGGGGASVGIEMALGRPVDIAINHDAAAIAMHKINHPQTEHLCCDVFEVDPRIVTRGRPIGAMWMSPDCTYHSKARGGKPIRSKLRKRRALAWVASKWTGLGKRGGPHTPPRVIYLENVEEFANWGPLVGAPDALRPCVRRRGRSFRKWVKHTFLDRGYAVEFRELRACEYGAPTIRKRLYLIAHLVREAAVWPLRTHGDPKHKSFKASGLLPHRMAADCIDWSIPMLSIFATKEEAKAWGKAHGQASPIRPLADNTNKRIARGVRRYVLNNKTPYVMKLPREGLAVPTMVPITHQGDRANRDVQEPHSTITCTHRGEDALAVATIAGVGGRAGQSPERPIDDPAATVTGKADAALAVSFLAPRYGEREGQEPRCRSIEDASPTVVTDGNGGSLVSAHLMTMRNSGKPDNEADAPAHTVTAEGAGLSLVATALSSFHSTKGAESRASSLEAPIATVDTQNRHAVIAAFMAQNNEGFYDSAGRALSDPSPTVCANGSSQSLIAVSMVDQHGTGHGVDAEDPGRTVEAGGNHHGLVAASLTTFRTGSTGSELTDPGNSVTANSGESSRPGGAAPVGLMAVHMQRDFGQSVGSDATEPIGTITGDGNGHAALIASFLAKFYGTGTGQELTEPAHTIPTLDRFGFVQVKLEKKSKIHTPEGLTLTLEENYDAYIDDIAMRMLQPHELYAMQGFPKSYIIDRGADGRKLTKSEQVRMCGNSVCPPVAAALVRANNPELIARSDREMKRREA